MLLNGFIECEGDVGEFVWGGQTVRKPIDTPKDDAGPGVRVGSIVCTLYVQFLEHFDHTLYSLFHNSKMVNFLYMSSTLFWITLKCHLLYSFYIKQL